MLKLKNIKANMMIGFLFCSEYVLRKSDGLHDLGPFNNWQLLLCLTVSWIIVYFCIFKGVKSSGKASHENCNNTLHIFDDDYVKMFF